LLNKDLINHRFPGGSFFLNKEMNDLIISVKFDSYINIIVS